jgi:hypothetical protein
MHAFKNIAVTVIVRFALVCSAVAMGSNEVLAREIAAQDYQFPYHDPYFATITIRLLKSQHLDSFRLMRCRAGIKFLCSRAAGASLLLFIHSRVPHRWCI